MEMVKRFQESGKSGFYLAVSKEGEFEIGNSLHLISSNANIATIAEVFTSDAD
jgi:MOSC domain-containing protein YiiM